MSGSGGSYMSPSAPSSSCASLSFDTQLASPQAQVVTQLNVSDVLDIAVTQTNSPVVTALWQGAVAGGIVHPQLNQLRSCMSQGEQYQARVLHINGGQVRLRVYHV